MNVVLEKQKKQIKERNALKNNDKLCPNCANELNSIGVCNKCNYHSRISYKERIDLLCDNGTFKELYKDMITNYSEQFDYKAKYDKSALESGLKEAVVSGKCKMNNHNVVICIMEYSFMAGTLGISNGEKITKTIEYATKNKLPLIILCASGGARIQEGVAALVQMAKIVSALEKHKQKGLLYVSCLLNPTLGGVTASFGLMGDINITEPNTTIGFAGKKVIKETINEDNNDYFQSELFNQEYGMIDIVCERKDLKNTITNILNILTIKNNFKIESRNVEFDYSKHNKVDILNKNRDITTNKCKDYIIKMFDEFYELHGDRISYDDSSIISGIGIINGLKVAIAAQNKGRNLNENIDCHYGMTSPEGYRKATRIAELAEKFELPLVLLIDSPGAYPSLKAEQNGQALSISTCMVKLLNTKTIILTYVIGEACSGGALSLSISDYIAMFSKSMYCVISPEAYIRIISKDMKINEKLLQDMKYSALDLYSNNLIDDVLKEKELEFNIEQIKNSILNKVNELSKINMKELLNNRYEKIRNWDSSVRGNK